MVQIVLIIFPFPLAKWSSSFVLIRVSDRVYAIWFILGVKNNLISVKLTNSSG